MKNKSYTVAYADINANTVQEIDVPLTFSENLVTGNVDVKTLYPNEILSINDTNANLEWTTIKDADEYADYLINSGVCYDFIPFPKNSTLGNGSNFYKCYKFLVRGTETSASSDLKITFINYIDR